MGPDAVHQSANPLAEPFFPAEHNCRRLDVAEQIVNLFQCLSETITRAPNFSRVVDGENFVVLPAQVDGNVPQLVDHVLAVTHPQHLRGLDGGVRLRGFTDHDEVFDLSNIEKREDAVNVAGYAEQSSSTITKLYVLHTHVIALSKRVAHSIHTYTSLRSDADYLLL